MSKRDNLLLVEDMLEAAIKITRYTANHNFIDFVEDEKTIDAVIRNFEIIGEAASRVEDDFQNHHDSVPWKILKGFRNRLIHEYFGVDLDIVWSIIKNELQELTEKLQQIIDPSIGYKT
jgi:uncharacterized protein with HEPN domain